MITFTKLGQLGRLGNVLWQYAALRGIGLKLNRPIFIPNTLDYSHHGQNCLLECFQIQRNYLSYKHQIQYTYTNIDKAQWFDDSVFSIPDDTDLLGYFQNLKYFEGYEDIIKKELQPNELFLYTARNYLVDLKKQINYKPIVSLHIRRGDLIQHAEKEKFDINKLYIEYFNVSMSYIKKTVDKNAHFLIFTGGNRGENLNVDMQWCKNNFKGNNIHYCCNQPTMIDFAIMSLCDHHISCHATSFGWWASYIYNNKNQIVIAPKIYHYQWLIDGMPSYYDVKEFYPQNWILL